MWKLAVIEVDGQTLTLRTPEAAEEAYINGLLELDTLVFTRDEAGRLTPTPMHELEQFRALLGLDAQTPASPASWEEPPAATSSTKAEVVTAQKPEQEEALPAETIPTGQGPVPPKGPLSALMANPEAQTGPSVPLQDHPEENTNGEPSATSPPQLSSLMAEATPAHTSMETESGARPQANVDEEAAAASPTPAAAPRAPAGGLSALMAANPATPADEETPQTPPAKADEPGPASLSTRATVAALPLSVIESLANTAQAPAEPAQDTGETARPEAPLPAPEDDPQEAAEPAGDGPVEEDYPGVDEDQHEAAETQDWDYAVQSRPDNAGGSSGLTRGPNLWLLGIIAVLVVMLAFLGYRQLSGSDEGLEQPAALADSNGQIVSGFAIIDAPVFESPDAATSTGESLIYGEQIELSALPDQPQWQRIESGPLQGRYIASDLVSTVPPAAIDRTRAGDLRLAMAAEVRSASSQQAPVLQTIAAGQPFRIIGIFTGADGGDWALIAMGSGSGLRPGYVYLSENVPLDDSDIPPVMDKRKAKESAAVERCTRLANAFERLACQYPDLARGESQLRNAYASAEQRFAAAGQQMLPYSRFRGRLDACQTAGCARDEIARQIELINGFQPTVAKVQTADRSAALKPRNDPGDWIKSRDYPKAALKEAREGDVSFALTIDTRGRVSNCTITRSSGHADLDEATCNAVKRRARFDPAREASGQAIPGTYSSSVRWRVP